jgi:hypothetical protein
MRQSFRSMNPREGDRDSQPYPCKTFCLIVFLFPYQTRERYPIACMLISSPQFLQEGIYDHVGKSLGLRSGAFPRTSRELTAYSASREYIDAYYCLFCIIARSGGASGLTYVF